MNSIRVKKIVRVLGSVVLFPTLLYGVLPAVVLIIFFATAVNLASQGVNTSTESKQQLIGRADFEKIMKSLSNWGRWGKDDQVGALNLITSEKRIQAARLVKTGMSISLAHDLFTEKIG